MQSEQDHPIQVVVRRTGLSPHVIRVWEKRYGAVVPTRTATNRRRYSDADIERLLLLRRATRAGRSIGQIAHLPTAQLLELITEDETLASPAVPAQPAAAPSLPRANGQVAVQPHLTACLSAVEQLTANALEVALLRAHTALSQPILLEQLIAPFLEEIGRLWHTGALRIMHEHFASAITRSFLGHLTRSFDVPQTAPTLIATTPAGQVHEIGALLAATTAAAAGWDVAYLGPNLPAEEIAAAAQQRQARAVALSLVHPMDDPRVADEVIQLRHYLPRDTVLFIGGRAVPAYASRLNIAGIQTLDALSALRTQLETLRAGIPL
jgi:methanogenic corrinoid protein MtbC1